MNNETATAPENAGPTLHAAIDHQDWPTVLALLKTGLSIDTPDDSGNSPLSLACRLGRLETVKKLIQLGANVKAANDSGHTPLMTAAIAEDPAVVQVLLKARANPNAITPANSHTPLHWALARPPRDAEKVAAIVQALLAAGAQVNHQSRDGTTPLMQAAWYGSERAISILLDHGANPQLGDNRGRNALALAKERSHENTCKLLTAAITASQTRKKENSFKKFIRWWNAEEK